MNRCRSWTVSRIDDIRWGMKLRSTVNRKVEDLGEKKRKEAK
jgi:hypothetical protein